jgi:hypothetical protein
MSKLSEFLAGDRLEDVALYLAEEQLDEAGKLAQVGDQQENGGVVLVVPGDQGRKMFSAGTGTDAMAFAKDAMGEAGSVDRNLAGGECPAGDGADHEVQFTFAFAEAENPEVGGMYADGDVIHAYAQCACGAAYSEKWVVGSRV